ncbi:KCNAW-like protein [Mya arenaria]|uniref:KCNAW-like protein n=1 Tax=Mya arenaria TaxID=6604 RepID=A0ABY7FKG1_MYAAR|nr:KCNAW-like protein [Mya arenaria]
MSVGEKGFIQLNIGGTVFCVQASSVKTFPSSLLSQLDTTHSSYNKAKDCYYFDQDPVSFRHVLNAYRNGELHVTRDVCPQQFRRDLEFWGLTLDLLAPCCWKYFYETMEDVETISKILATLSHPAHNQVGIINENKLGNTDRTNNCEKVKSTSKLYTFLEEPTSSLGAKIFCYLYMVLAVASISLVIISLEQWARVDSYIDPKTMSNYSIWDFSELEIAIIAQASGVSVKVLWFYLSDPALSVLVLDLSILTFFVIETVLHFCSCPDKKSYWRNTYNLVKITLILSTAVTLVFEMKKSLLNSDLRFIAYIFCKSLCVMRLLLVFRLRKLYRSLDILLLSMSNSVRELALLLFAFSVCIIIYGILISAAEVQKDTFDNIFNAMWWALITMTTIGYGDYFPTTSMGYLVGVLCAINGLIVLALPVAALASNFAKFYTHYGHFARMEAEINNKPNIEPSPGCTVEDLENKPD